MTGFALLLHFAPPSSSAHGATNQTRGGHAARVHVIEDLALAVQRVPRPGIFWRTVLSYVAICCHSDDLRWREMCYHRLCSQREVYSL